MQHALRSGWATNPSRAVVLAANEADSLIAALVALAREFGLLTVTTGTDGDLMVTDSGAGALVGGE